MNYERIIINMDIKIAEWMLEFITRVCNKHKGLCISKASKLSGEKVYELQWCDC
jgi:hypothetical protein